MRSSPTTDLTRVVVGDIVLIAVAAAIFSPYAIAGPGFFIDDWFTLRNAEVLGWWRSAGPAQWSARPGASLVYALTFGLIGETPTAHFLLAAAVAALTAVVIHRIARRYLRPTSALALAGLWLVLPNHTSLEMWPSALNIGLALLLLLMGMERLTSPWSDQSSDLMAAALFGLSVLSYEATAPAAIAVVVAVAASREGAESWRAAIPSLATIGGAGLWMLLNWHPEKKGLDAWIDIPQVVAAHFGQTITGDRISASLLSAFVLIASAVAVYHHLRTTGGRGSDRAAQLVVAGWATILLGALPFVRYFYAPLGLGDRVTVVSSVGGVMVLLGLASLVSRRSRPAAILVLGVVLVTAIPQRVSMVRHYAIAADDSRRILAAVTERWPQPPDRTIVFGPEPIVERNVVAFYEMTLPLRLVYGEDVDARLTFEPGDFFAAPQAWRVDLRAHSKLDDGRLGEP